MGIFFPQEYLFHHVTIKKYKLFCHFLPFKKGTFYFQFSVARIKFSISFTKLFPIVVFYSENYQ